MSVHDLDLARFLVGEVEEVHAWAAAPVGRSVHQGRRWDTSVYHDEVPQRGAGRRGDRPALQVGYDIRAEIAGATGKVVVDGERRRRQPTTARVAAESDLYPDYMERFEIGYRRELEAFFDDLGAGRPVGPGPDDAYETLRLAVACTRSWRENRPIRLDKVTA